MKSTDRHCSTQYNSNIALIPSTYSDGTTIEAYIKSSQEQKYRDYVDAFKDWHSERRVGQCALLSHSVSGSQL